MKKIIFIFLCVLGSVQLSAQQEAIFSQYHLNRFLINPAVAGTNYFKSIYTNMRFQWTGLPNAPKTGLVSFHTKFSNIGIGGMLFSDRVASLNRFGFNFAYAYHTRMNKNTLSIGLSGQYQRFSLDRSAMHGVENSDDPVVYEAMDGLNVYDANLGLYLSNEKMYVGFSIPNIIQARLATLGTETNTLAQLSRQYLFMAGYRYHQKKAPFSIAPSVLLRKIAGASFQADLTLKIGMLNEKFFTAFTYGTSEVITIHLGYQLKEECMVAYSYDYSIGDLYQFTRGSHEISFLWELGRKDFIKKQGRNRFKG